MSRQLDIAIHKLLGREEKGLWCEGAYIITHPVLKYCSDGNAMLDLIQEMEKRGYHFSAIGKVVKFRKDGIGYYPLSLCDTLPLAVAMAAYNALTEGKEWNDEG